MNVSDVIFDFFSKKGADTAFVITGGQAMYLDDALYRSGKYRTVFFHHEQAASMSADAYGRLKGKPALTVVTAGPGAVNAMNGVVGGYTDSSPMIVISGHTNLAFVKYQEAHAIRQYGVQGINIGPIARPIVKYFATIEDTEKLQSILETAWNYATNGRPGPVWLEVPLDMQRKEASAVLSNADDAAPPFASAASSTNGCKDNRMDIGMVKQAVKGIYERLLQSKRPIILAGQGISLAGARKEFRTFAEAAHIPVLTARLGIDLIESDNPLYVGRPGNYGERAANFAVQNADLILSVGCRLASSLVGHEPASFGAHAKKIAVDIDKAELDKPGVNINMKICADCLDVLQCLCGYKDRYTLPDWSGWAAQCGEWKRQYPVVLPEYKNEIPINSYYFIDRLSDMAAQDACILVDTGSCFHAACQTWKIKRGQKFLTTGGISSMGYWCAGIGACEANGGRETIVITGDGSLQMNIQELATMRGNNLPIKLFVLNNNGYLLIRHTQRNFMDDRFTGESPATGVWCPDTVKVSSAYGIKAFRISTPQEADGVIKEVLHTAGPVVCEVMTPEWQALIPRISSEKMPDGSLKAHDYADMFPFLDRTEYKANMIAEKEIL